MLQLCLTFAFKSSMALCQMNPKTENIWPKKSTFPQELTESWHQFSSQVSKIWDSLKKWSHTSTGNKSMELLTSNRPHIGVLCISWTTSDLTHQSVLVFISVQGCWPCTTDMQTWSSARPEFKSKDGLCDCRKTLCTGNLLALMAWDKSE